MRFLPGIFLLILAYAPAAWSRQSVPPLDTPRASTRDRLAGERLRAAAAPGTRRALILCGHPGDDEHRSSFREVIEKLHKALVGRYGFPASEVRVLFGAKPAADDGAAVRGARGLCTREGIEAEVASMAKQLKPEDALWVIVLGHAHFDGRHAFLNLPGPDIRADEFGKLFETFEAREQVLFITTPVSGYFIKSLSAPRRIVVTATEPDLEVNETLYAQALADVLADPPADFDFDKDGVRTVLDLYLAVARQVMERYVADENIPTEHAQLDDNGDGRGTEVQLDYLPPDLGGRARPNIRPEIKPSADGARAVQVRLHEERRAGVP